MKDKVIGLEKERTQVYKTAFESEKDLTDRALKIAESSKKSPLETLGILGIFATIAITILSVF